MSSARRPSTLFIYNFSSKKIRSDTEALTPNSNTATAMTITTSDDSNLFLSNDPQDLDHVANEANFLVKSTDLKVINSLSETNKNDISYYLLNKLSIGVNLKYSLLTNHLKPNRKYSFSTLYSNDHKHSRRFPINWLNDNSFFVYSP